MLQYIKKHLLGLLASLYSLLVALFWMALRSNWSGISGFLGAETNPTFVVMNLPLFVCVFLWLVFGFSVLSLLRFRKKLPSVFVLVISVIFTGAIVAVILLGAADYLPFVLPHFWRSLAICTAFITLAALLCFPPKHKAVRWSVLLICGALALCCIVRPNSITYSPVVYAVEDEYQIVFSTARNSTAWVEIGDQTYYDLYAGSLRSQSTVHKIHVPQAALDEAGDYTVFAQSMIYRGPFGGYKGRVLSEQHSFRPVPAENFNYYSLSDVHGSFDAAINAAKQQAPDFLILLGDLVSMVETETDAQAANYIAYEVTNGQIPVLYPRGNHETKGAFAEELHRYVGSKNEAFYYTFRLGSIDGVMLDLGEDHADDWWEFYGTAQYDCYREQETAFLRTVALEADYRLAVCHIPIPFINSRRDQEAIKTEWTTLLNDLQLNCFVSGHQHELNVFQPGVIPPFTELTYNENYREPKAYKGCLTDFNFPGFIVSRKSNLQTGATKSLHTDEFTGLRVDVTPAGQSACFTNAKGETVPVCNLFGNDAPGTSFDS